MTISAFPFETQDTTETQFSLLFRELQDSGMADTHGGSAFAVSASAGMVLNVQAGNAIVRGFMVSSTATETVTIGAASAQPRKDRVILRLDPTANSIVLAVLPGTPAASPVPPVLTQDSTGIYEIGLAIVDVNVGVGSIVAGNITDTREYVGGFVGAWRTSTRPTSPRMARLGYNAETSTWEFWTGTAWATLIPSTVNNATRWNGYTLNVSATTPSGTPTTDRIWIQPTA